MDKQKTLDWLRDVSEQAFSEARGGNTALANKLGKTPATQYYFNNVHLLKTVTAEQFAAQYAGYMTEADQMRVEYEALEAAVDAGERITKLEAELQRLGAVIAGLTEAAVDKPKAKKAKAVKENAETPSAEVKDKEEAAAEPEEDQPEAEPEPEADAAGDAEEA